MPLINDFRSPSTDDNDLVKYDQESIMKLSKTLAENMEKIASGLNNIHNDMQQLSEKHKGLPEIFASVMEQMQPVADADALEENKQIVEQ